MTPLKVVIIENRPENAELLAHALTEAGFEPHWKRIETEEAFLSQLDHGLDLILSDYRLGEFSAIRALQILNHSGLDVPLIIVCDTISKATAEEAMKLGAADYLLKNRLECLGTVVNQALECSRGRQDGKLAEEVLRETEGRLHVLNDSPALMFVKDTAGRYQQVNRLFEKLLGQPRAKVIGKTDAEIFPHEQAVAFQASDRQVMQSGMLLQFEERIETIGGTLISIVSKFPLRDNGGRITGLCGIATDITERKRIEEDLRTAKQTIQTIFDSAPVAIVGVDLNGRIVKWNAGAFRMFGWTEEEVQGRVCPTVPLSGMSDYLRMIGRVAREGPQTGMIAVRTTKSGKRIEASLSAAALQDAAGEAVGVMVILEDVTERRQAEAALRESEAQFRQVVENIREVIWMIDPEKNRVLYVSPGFETIWGRPCQHLYSEPRLWIQCIHPEDRERVLQAVTSKQIHGDYDEVYRITRPDGAVRWIRDRAFPIKGPAGNVHRIVGTAEDITEHRMFEEQFRQAQKIEAVGTLAGGLAHDFNNILAAIHGYTELSRLILKGNPEVRDHLGAVLQATRRATDLVRQVLSFSRQEPQERRAIQLRPVVAETLQLLRATIPSTIEFEVSLAADVPVVLADPTQIHRVLMNLGTNAWHAMKDHPGRLQVKLDRCVLDARLAATEKRLRPGIYAHLSVRDTGSGMDEAMQQRIFEPFFTTKSPGEGTGLGLAVVHGIMESHEGAITVCSRPKEGTVFHLYFPAHAGEAARAATETEPVPRGHSERLLFVDDEEFLVRLGEKTLTELGYEVEVATRPAAALAMVQAQPQRFALVLADFRMPKMTGLQLASQLHRIRPGLPIILMTGYSASLTAERVKAAGILQLLPKPTTFRSLGTAVHAALSAPLHPT